MIKQLHPTLKKCACGFIGTRRELYKHFDTLSKFPGFFIRHGEVPLNTDDPALDVEKALKESGLEKLGYKYVGTEVGRDSVDWNNSNIQ